MMGEGGRPYVTCSTFSSAYAALLFLRPPQMLHAHGKITVITMRHYIVTVFQEAVDLVVDCQPEKNVDFPRFFLVRIVPHTTAELLASLLPTLSSHNGTVIAVIYS